MNNREVINVFINGKEFQFNKGLTIIQACSKASIDIPRFCFHEKLNIAGNCRMCLVEVVGTPKPVASCAMTIGPNMQIYTNTVLVKKARVGVLEFLLANHPLDCPICDQGGECDLQDQTIVFGNDRGRFYENKRSVQDKNLGPFVKTIMTRCIHCTRCVRFGSEIAGVDFLGTTGRGQHTEIGTYVSKILDSEFSGNIIDLCPVGALTSKPYMFKARSWELRSVETIDVFDSIGSSIRVDVRGLDVMRILPRLNERVNEDWITDKTRFAYDGLKKQRLQAPLVKILGEFIPVSWKRVFFWVSAQISSIKNKSFCGISGLYNDLESLYAMREFFLKLGSYDFYSQNYNKVALDFRSSYLLNIPLDLIDKTVFCLLIGINPRLELPLLNLRLRKSVLHYKSVILLIGSFSNLTYTVNNISNSIKGVLQFLKGKSLFCRLFLRSKSSAVFIGSSILERKGGLDLYNSVFCALNSKRKDKERSVVSLVSNFSGHVNSFELGFNGLNKLITNKVQSRNLILYLLGSDDSRLQNRLLNKDVSFILYQGFFGDELSACADVVFPGVSFLEKNSLFLNNEGRLQRNQFVLFPPGLARSDWKIISVFSKFLGNNINIKSLSTLRTNLYKFLGLFNVQKDLRVSVCISSGVTNTLVQYFNSCDLFSYGNIGLNLASNNFYLSDPVSRLSTSMLKASSNLVTNVMFIDKLKYIKY